MVVVLYCIAIQFFPDRSVSSIRVGNMEFWNAETTGHFQPEPESGYSGISHLCATRHPDEVPFLVDTKTPKRVRIRATVTVTYVVDCSRAAV